jgi:hypothetical protein
MLRLVFSAYYKWFPDCYLKSQREGLRRGKGRRPNFVVLALEVEMTYELHGQAAAACEPFPGRTDVHWETTNLQLWNAREGTTEQQELVYEVSWIQELGIWRRFLTSRRTVRGERQGVPC